MSTDTFERPRLLGRGVRLILGGSLLVLGIETLMTPTAWISQSVPQSPVMWLGTAVCFYFLRGVPDKGLQRAWGRWPQLVVVLLALVAVIYNLARTGSWWGQPLGALIFVLIICVSAHLGLSFVLASLLAHPG